MARVLDLTRLLPGPLCARILAAMGHEVVRVAAPGGDWLEAAAPTTFDWLHPEPDAETLDLKTESGRARMRELAAGADVLLENHLPGRMEAWGVGPEALRESNPGLVYVRMVGSRAPESAGLPGHDLTYLAASGLLPSLDAAWRALPLADLCGAFWAALAVERGLREGGGVFEVYLEEAAHAAAFPPIAGLDGSSARYAVYECAEGAVALAALEPHLWERFCQAAKRADWMADAQRGAVAAYFQQRTAAEWEFWGRAHGVPLRRVREAAAAGVPLPWRMS